MPNIDELILAFQATLPAKRAIYSGPTEVGQRIEANAQAQRDAVRTNARPFGMDSTYLAKAAENRNRQVVEYVDDSDERLTDAEFFLKRDLERAEYVAELKAADTDRLLAGALKIAQREFAK